MHAWADLAMARRLLGHTLVMGRVDNGAATRCRAAWATLALLATVAAAGCGEIDTSSSAFDESSHAGDRSPHARHDTAPMWAKHASLGCPEPAALLVHHDSAGRVDRVHATLTARGIRGPYLVDTGSFASFATSTGDEVAPSAQTTLACSETTLPIIGRLRPGSTPDGTPQAGVLGANLVAHGAVLDLDLKKATLGWYQPAPAPPPGAVVLPVERRKGWLIASGIRVRGRDVKLVIDTGATNVILVDPTPRAGEIREDTVDGTASAITLWHGDGEISFAGGAVRHVPIDRTDQFATLQGLISELGSDVEGLLGITAMGRDRIIIGRDSLMIVLPPVTPNPL